MTPAELRTVLVNYAKADMRKARQQNSGIYISQTKVGLVDLSYNADTKLYTAFNQDGSFNLAAKAGEMADAIANVYDVIFE